MSDHSDVGKTGKALGLRDAISSRHETHRSAVDERAIQLFNELKVIECVTDAIDYGGTEVAIELPIEIQKIGPWDAFSGPFEWGHVMQQLCKLIEAEDVEVFVGTKNGTWCDVCGSIHPPNRQRLDSHKRTNRALNKRIGLEKCEGEWVHSILKMPELYTTVTLEWGQ